ncbi:MAG: hypothetical protein OEM82_08810 [Acidobacteriota bacterium]|nr:hypothetical protein [Acidobacteriota bacterium]MDH3529037.1 hypothetical protein [Acidobacteriota bacterium]
MNCQALHQNLDTTFVNLSALIKYLRKRQFVGIVNIQLNGYRAEIHLKANHKIDVREDDRISGRISTGKEAFQRVLIRSREPGGSINVYQLKITENKADAGPSLQNGSVPKARPRRAASPAPLQQTPEIHRAKAGNSSPKPKTKPNGCEKPRIAKTPGEYQRRDELIPLDLAEFVPKTNAESRVEENPVRHQTSLPDFPFELTNKVELKARQRQLATEDWQTLLKLTVELLGVVDRSLENHRLDFAAAYRKACAEIACDYPFMNPALKIFDYENGRVTMKKQVNEAVFVNSVAESLGRIIEKLGQNPKFGTVYRDTNHLIIALINKRKTSYDRFGFTVPLERIVGL